MQDPETMRILVDPDNLRALGEAPQMIELDFADPNGFIPEDDFIDIEMGDDATDGGATDFADLHVDYDNDGGGDFDADAEDAEGWYVKIYYCDVMCVCACVCVYENMK